MSGPKERPPGVSQKPVSVAERFNEVKRSLRYTVVYLRDKKDTKMLGNEMDKIKNSPVLTNAGQVNTLLRGLAGKPVYLLGRPANVQSLFIGTIISKVSESAPKSVKSSLLKRFELLHTTVAQDQVDQTQKLLKKYGVGEILFGPKSREEKAASGDPLLDVPEGIPLDKSFLKGPDPKDLLPLGYEKSKKLLPPDILKILKNADAFQIAFFKWASINIYNPVIKWYNTLSEPFPKNIVGYTLIKPFQFFFKVTIKNLTAKALSSVPDAVQYVVEKFSGGMKYLAKIPDLLPPGIPKSIKEALKKLLDVNKTMSSFNKTIKELVKVSKGILKIAARNPHDMRKERIRAKGNCFFLNKLFILVLNQHKGSSGTDKYIIEFFALTIGNFKNDKELRRLSKAMRPSLMYLCNKTLLGEQLTKMVGIPKTWRSMNQKERQHVLNTVFDLLLPDKFLTKEEEKRPLNQSYLSLHQMYNRAIAKLIEKTPHLKSRSNLFLGINMMMENIRINLVKTGGDRKKAERQLAQLEKTLRILNKRLDPKEKQALTKGNPILAQILDNPEHIRKTMLALAKGMEGTESLTAAGKVVFEVAQSKILALQQEANNYVTKLKDLKKKFNRAKTSFEKMKLKNLILAYVTRLKDVDRERLDLLNTRNLLRNAKTQEAIASLGPMIRSSLLSDVPEKLRKTIPLGTLVERVTTKARKRTVDFASQVCNSVIKHSNLRFVFAKYYPSSAVTFTSLVLNHAQSLQGESAKAREFLQTKSNRESITKKIFQLALKSLEGSQYHPKLVTEQGEYKPHAKSLYKFIKKSVRKIRRQYA